jgi:hypothetical protein
MGRTNHGNALHELLIIVRRLAVSERRWTNPVAKDPLHPKPLNRVIRRNPKTKATDHERDIYPTWSPLPTRGRYAAPKPQPGESWWLEPANLERGRFQAEARQRHPNKLGIPLKDQP